MRRSIIPAILVIGILLAAILGGQWWGQLSDWIAQAGFPGQLAFYGAFVALTTLCFPVSVLGFSAGAIFGPLKGLLLMLVSGVSSGLVMFAVGRFLFRYRLHAWIQDKPKLLALDRMAAKRAIRLNFLARLSPLNYGLVCYTLASGKSPFRFYVLGLLAIVPGMAGQVWVGHLSVSAREAFSGQGKSPLEWGMMVAGLLFFLLLSWQVGRMIKQAWSLEGNDNEIHK